MGRLPWWENGSVFFTWPSTGVFYHLTLRSFLCSTLYWSLIVWVSDSVSPQFERLCLFGHIWVRCKKPSRRLWCGGGNQNQEWPEDNGDSFRKFCKYESQHAASVCGCAKVELRRRNPHNVCPTSDALWQQLHFKNSLSSRQILRRSCRKPRTSTYHEHMGRLRVGGNVTSTSARTQFTTPWIWRQHGPPKRRYPTTSLNESQPRRPWIEASYGHFRENELQLHLDNVPLQTRRMWIHDGTSPHFGRDVTDHLKANCQGRW
jgi:hypothetical protein